MNQSRWLFPAVAVYGTELVACCNTYMFFYSTQDQGYGFVELWPWLLLGFGAFFLVHQYLKREPALGALVLLATGCFLVMATVMSLWFVHATSGLGWVLALLLFAITIVRACLLNMGLFTMQNVLVGCELPAMGLAFLLWLHTSAVFYLPTYYIVCTLLALGFNVLALTFLRLHPKDAVENGPSGGALLASGSCIVALGAIALGVSSVLASLASATVSKTAAAIAAVARVVFSWIAAFFNWLDSLLPRMETTPVELEAMESLPAGEMQAMEEMNMDFFVVLTLVIGILILLGLVLLILRFRKWKLSLQSQKIVYHRPKQTVEKVGLWRRLRLFLQKKYQQVVFAIWVVLKRNTPQGAVIFFSRIGKPYGLQQKRGESYGGYLMRLSRCCGAEDAEVAGLFVQLSTLLDGLLYGAQPPQTTLQPRAYRHMRKAIVKSKRTKKTLNER